MILITLLTAIKSISPEATYAIAPVVIGAIISAAGTGAQIGADANLKKKLAKLNSAEASALQAALAKEQSQAKREQMIKDAADKAQRRELIYILMGVSLALVGVYYAFKAKRK